MSVRPKIHRDMGCEYQNKRFIWHCSMSVKLITKFSEAKEGWVNMRENFSGNSKCCKHALTLT